MDKGADKIQLPKGITGFWQHGEVAVPTVDTGAFEKLCQGAVVKLGGSVQETTGDSTCNFRAITMSFNGKNVTVVCNDHAPFIAFINSPPDGTLLDFVDNEEAANALASSEFRLLSVAELQRSVDQLDLTQLGEAEMDQVEYWKPETAGELIFNHWD
jgi:hypothetical protein